MVIQSFNSPISKETNHEKRNNPWAAPTRHEKSGLIKAEPTRFQRRALRENTENLGNRVVTGYDADIAQKQMVSQTLGTLETLNGCLFPQSYGHFRLMVLVLTCFDPSPAGCLDQT